MNKTQLTYDILENGYQIKLDGKTWIEQIGEYSKPMDSSKSYEENAILQIEDLTKEVISEESEVDKNIASLQTSDIENKVAIAQVYEMILGMATV